MEAARLDCSAGVDGYPTRDHYRNYLVAQRPFCTASSRRCSCARIIRHVVDRHKSKHGWFTARCGRSLVLAHSCPVDRARSILACRRTRHNSINRGRVARIRRPVSMSASCPLHGICSSLHLRRIFHILSQQWCRRKEHRAWSIISLVDVVFWEALQRQARQFSLQHAAVRRS